MPSDTRETSSLVGTLLPYLKGLKGTNVNPITLCEQVQTTYTQDSSRFRGRMPLTIPRDDASDVKSLGSFSQGSCAVGGDNSGTKRLQNEGGGLSGIPSPPNSSAFDSSIPSCSMISNSSHPAFDHMDLKSVARSSTSTLDSRSLSSTSVLEGGWPSIDDPIVVPSAHSSGRGSSSRDLRSINEMWYRGRSNARLHTQCDVSLCSLSIPNISYL